MNKIYIYKINNELTSTFFIISASFDCFNTVSVE